MGEWGDDVFTCPCVVCEAGMPVATEDEEEEGEEEEKKKEGAVEIQKVSQPSIHRHYPPFLPPHKPCPPPLGSLRADACLCVCLCYRWRRTWSLFVIRSST